MTQPHIILVDDEAPIRHALRRLLTFDDYHLSCAASAKEALLSLQKASTDVIISDHDMPDCSGVDLLRKVRDSSPETTRILFSGHIDIELLRAAVNAGEVYRFITKPWNDDELRMAVRHGVERARLLRQNLDLQERQRRQNDELRRFNANLEAMVTSRTEDLELRNRALGLSQDVLDQLPVLVIGIDPRGTIALVNALARNLLPGIVPGDTFSEGLPTQLIAWIHCHLNSTEAPGQSIILQLHCGRISFELGSLDGRGLILTGQPLPTTPAQ